VKEHFQHLKENFQQMVRAQFRRIAITPRTQLQINILRALSGEDVNAFVGRLVDAEWGRVLAQGKVTDAALEDVSGAGNSHEPVTYKQIKQE
jgi:hypothetical protein